MAITTNAICNSFKKELLEAKHNFSNPGGDTYKLAMFTNSATLGKSTTNYATANEVSSPTGGYSAGGKALVNQGVKPKMVLVFIGETVKFLSTKQDEAFEMEN